MNLEFNEKGKYYTDVISKATVPAIIQTATHRIEGFVHVRLNERLKDELDRGEAFLAVTDAKVFSNAGLLVYQADFLSVSRAQIIWVIPAGDENKSGDQ